MSAPWDITVIDVPRAGDALLALPRLGDRDLVVIASPLSDRLAPTGATLDAGPDLKRLVLDDPEGEAAIPAARRAIARDPAWRAIVVGPDACPPARDAAGRLLVLSALGPSVRPLRRALPAARLALDVGLDAFAGLEAAARAALAPDLRKDLAAVVLLGLRPDPGTARRLVAVTAGLPVMAWDPSAVHVRAWRELGVVATTSFDAAARSAELLVAPEYVDGDVDGDALGGAALVATSPALAELVAETLGLRRGALPEPVARRLASELPAGTVAELPLVLPELPAPPGLPPRHHRHVAVALEALGEDGTAIVLAIGDDDPLAEVAAAHPLAAARRLTLVTLATLPAHAAARALAADARAAATAPRLDPPAPALDDRLQALLLAAALGRAATVQGATALAIAGALTGLPAAHRVVVTTPGHAEAVARRAGGPQLIGLDASFAGPAPRGEGTVAKATPAPVRGETPAALFDAFTAVAPAPPSPLAFAPRFVVPIDADARLRRIEVRVAPIAPKVSVDGKDAGSGDDAALAAVVAALRDALAADDIFEAVTLYLRCDPHGAPEAVVDATLALARPTGG